MYHSCFIHSSVLGHLGCFHVLAKWCYSEHRGTCVFSIMVSSGYMPSSGTAGSHGSFIPRFVFFFPTTLLLPTHLPPPLCTHAQSYNPMDYSLPGSSVHGLFQARMLEWVAISFSYSEVFKESPYRLP